VVLARDPKVFTAELTSTIRIPLCGLCDLCAMLSSSRGSRT
jgi:hypothetical protein